MADSQLINVLLVTANNQTSDWLISMLRSEPGLLLAGWVPSLTQASDMVNQRNVDVILLDGSASDARNLSRLQSLAAMPGGPALILMTDATDMGFVQQAMFAGARGFLLKPFTQQQLLENLRQVYDVILQQQQTAAVQTDAARREQSATVLAVYSPKGTVGRTSLACNLAIALYQETKQPVVLVDGDLQFGNVDIAINAIAKVSVADLLNHLDDLDSSLIESTLIPHSSGIRLLLAPPYFDPSLEAREGQLAHIIKMMASAQTGYVVVDAPTGLGEATLDLLDVAQTILLPTGTQLSSLRATKRFLELAASLRFPPDKIALILNAYHKGTDVPVEDIERHLGRSMAAVVPHDATAMSLALSQGQPIILRDRNHPVSKSIINLARQLSGGPTGGTARRSLGMAFLPERRASTSAMSRLLRPGHAMGM